MNPPVNPNDERSIDEQRRQTWRRSLTITAILVAVLFLIWLIRSCGGFGAGTSDEGDEEVLLVDAAEVPGGDAGGLPGGDAAAPAVPPCQLHLGSQGLFLRGPEGQKPNEALGSPISIEEAVRVCRAAGKAELRVTGGATMGDYEALIRALDEAGITVTLQHRPEQSPQTGEPEPPVLP